MGEVKTRTKASSSVSVPPLCIGLSDPGMTPILRAGLGGLAASLRAILLEEEPAARWPAPVALGPGSAVVETRTITLQWGAKPPEETLSVLFEKSLRTSKRTGLIEFPGTWASGPPPQPLAVQLQDAVKKTFLQHGQSTTKAAGRKTVTYEVDGKGIPVAYQPYEGFAHQGAWEKVAAALKGKRAELAGWAYPGAAQRHIGIPRTKWEYSAAEGLAACFAIVGCLSFSVPSTRGGAIVVPDPEDLVRFGEARRRLSPTRPEQCSVAGIGDAVLAVSLTLRAESIARRSAGISGATGVLLESTPWASKQKCRSSIVDFAALPEILLDLYEKVSAVLPARVRVSPAKGESQGGSAKEEGIYVTTSALRAFVTENLARGHRWFEGFATAKAGAKRDLFVHYFRAKKGLGALYPEEKEGLVVMVECLEETEKAFVRSVHLAIRSRFGAIASETSGSPATMKNRFGSERDKWRLAFSGAKTHEQIRASLADLWSRGGSNAELKENWEQILPLLRSERWQEARDLALVGLASYRGQRPEETEECDA